MNAEDAGEAYVFTRTERDWGIDDPVTLFHPDPGEYDLFGREVELSGNGSEAIVSASNALMYEFGEVYLFEREGAPLAFEDQTSTGSSVTVDRVTMPEGGFVVIASPDGKTVYGASEYLSPGRVTNLRVTLDTPLPGTGTYLAAGQADTNDDREFDAFRVRDDCLLDLDGSPLVDTATVTLEEC